MNRGYTLIEVMVAVATLGLSMRILFASFDTYQAAADRTRAVEQLARVLDIEAERMSTCDYISCFMHPEPSKEAETWSRVRLQRHMSPGPDGTLQIVIEAENEAGTRQLTVLFRRPR